YCDHHKRELFIAGHLPEATCDWHQLVCGVPAIVYPDAVRAWTRDHGRAQPPVCEASPAGAVRITTPVDGSHFVLEPFRAPAVQRPLLAALPSAPDLRWTIDGEPAERWIPTPGSHRVAVARGDSHDEITISYE